MTSTATLEVEIPPEAAEKFEEAARLMEKGGVPGVSPELMVAFVVVLANPALVVRRTLTHYDPQSLTIDEEYDLEIGFVRA